MPPFPSGPLPMIFDGDLHWGFEYRAYAEHLTDDEQVNLQALAALLDRDEKTALPEIKRLAREHENWAMRASAVAMLADSESAESLVILDEALNKDTDRRVRKAAVRALANHSEPEAREILKRLLQQ
jgi:HEAT repeat protein